MISTSEPALISIRWSVALLGKITEHPDSPGAPEL